MDGGPPLPVTLAILLLITPILGLIHELGHAIAALVLLPGRVVIKVGGPEPLVGAEVGRLTVAFHPLVLPWRFDAVCIYEEEPTSRVQTIVIALAGPAASLIAGIVTLNALGRVGPGLLWDVIALTTFAAFFSVIVCMVTLTLTDASGTRLRTDGATVIDALR